MKAGEVIFDHEALGLRLSVGVTSAGRPLTFDIRTLADDKLVWSTPVRACAEAFLLGALYRKGETK